MNGFAFLAGTWNVANRRLARVLAGDDEWEEFPATARCIPLFGGAANVDEIVVPEKGFIGATFRLFDPARREWSIYWASSGDGLLQPPVVGGFSDGVGTFYGDDVYDGRKIRVRYIWSGITPVSARWEQAFSVDDEATWETNWIMELTRHV